MRNKFGGVLVHLAGWCTCAGNRVLPYPILRPNNQPSPSHPQLSFFLAHCGDKSHHKSDLGIFHSDLEFNSTRRSAFRSVHSVQLPSRILSMIRRQARCRCCTKLATSKRCSSSLASHNLNSSQISTCKVPPTWKLYLDNNGICFFPSDSLN